MAVSTVPSRSAAVELAELLDSPEIRRLIADLEATRWTGRPGYPIRAMVGMALAKGIYAIPTWTRTVALVRVDRARSARTLLVLLWGSMPFIQAAASSRRAATAEATVGADSPGITSWTRSPVGSVASSAMPIAAISRNALSVVGLAVAEVNSRLTLEASKPARLARARLVMPCFSRVASSIVSNAIVDAVRTTGPDRWKDRTMRERYPRLLALSAGMTSVLRSPPSAHASCRGHLAFTRHP
jgi:hypothetical protein